jgi:hypothetical protein
MISAHKLFLKIASWLFFPLQSEKNPNGSVLISNLQANVYRINTSNTIIALTFPSPPPAPLLPSFQNVIEKYQQAKACAHFQYMVLKAGLSHWGRDTIAHAS